MPSEDPQRQGQMTFEDVDLADMRIVRATKAESEFFRKESANFCAAFLTGYASL